MEQIKKKGGGNKSVIEKCLGGIKEHSVGKREIGVMREGKEETGAEYNLILIYHEQW